MVSSATRSGRIGPHWASHARTRCGHGTFLRATAPHATGAVAPGPPAGPPPGTEAPMIVRDDARADPRVPARRAAGAAPGVAAAGRGLAAGWLFAAWLVYGVAILVAMRFPARPGSCCPILVVAFIAPFVAGPERLTRVLRGRGRAGPRPVVDVTPTRRRAGRRATCRRRRRRGAGRPTWTTVD